MPTSRLKPCVDCGHMLSPTAKSCINCNSTDPFGIARGQQQFNLVMALVFALVVGIVGGAVYFGFLPFETLKSYILPNR